MLQSTPHSNSQATVLEICAGAGGQAIGLERAGFSHLALVEIDSHCCKTLSLNKPEWQVIEKDVRSFDGTPFRGFVDLLAGGIPCPPFSIAGKQLGAQDERNLMPELLRLTEEIRPKAVLLENVPGLMRKGFNNYREEVNQAFVDLGYEPNWAVLNASDFNVPQARPRAIMVAFQKSLDVTFVFPTPSLEKAPTVGEALFELMAERGWPGAQEWAAQANRIAPTIVGGSKKHGGPDLGPTGAKKAWATINVNGKRLEYLDPDKEYDEMPYLTVQMVARIQGFPSDWLFSGKKAPAYRQVGNAFPPPVAEAVGRAIIKQLYPDELPTKSLEARSHAPNVSPQQTALPLP